MTEKKKEFWEEHKKKSGDMRQSKNGSYIKRAEQLLYAQQGLCIRIEALEEELSYLRALRDHSVRKRTTTAHVHTEAEVATLRREKTKPQYGGEKQGTLLFFTPTDAGQIEERVYDIQCELAFNRLTLRRIENAVEMLQNDPYYDILYLKYVIGMPEEEIAYQIHCDTSTVRRNKHRLLERLAVILYGASALSAAV